jgi:hypothetical protein
MPRTDKSTAILTGMIIAALYVILLVGFARESYMRRDAASRAHVAVTQDAVQNDANRDCRVEPPLCAALFADARERSNCMTSLEAVQRYLNDPVLPLSLDGLRRAMGEEP